MKQVSTFLIALAGGALLAGGGTAAAQAASDQVRDVNSAGPFPVYIAVQRAWAPGFEEFRYLSTKFTENYPEAKDRKSLYGWEYGLGFAINEKRINNVYLELNYRVLRRHLSRNLNPGPNGVEQTLLFRNETVSLRLGKRVNVYYPITLQVQGGPILFQQITGRPGVKLTNDTLTVTGRRFGNSFFNDWFPGMNAKVRLNFLDPIGASGGLGLYLEGDASYYATRLPVERILGFFPSVRPAPAPGSFQRKSRWSYTWSFGCVVPLALRFKQFPLRLGLLCRRISGKEKK
jgi:hypothetical protein